jgi:HPt (histidine-containing phosphotransfer) domain-containing protein
VGATFDPTVLGQLVGGDEDAIDELLADYLANVRELRPAMAAEGRHSLAHIAGIAHRLKSSSQAVGALALARACQTLEDACGAGNAAHAHATFEQVRALLDDMEARLMARLDEKVN